MLTGILFMTFTWILEIKSVPPLTQNIFDTIKHDNRALNFLRSPTALKEIKSPLSMRNSENNGETLLIAKLTNDQLIKLLRGLLHENNDKNAFVQPSDKLYLDNKDDKMQELPEFRLQKYEIPTNPNLESKYIVHQKLSQMLKDRAQTYFETKEDGYANEILFNFLTTQLNSLCCNKHAKDHNEDLNLSKNREARVNMNKESEDVFLIMNDKDIVKNDEPFYIDPNNDKLSIIPIGSVPSHLQNRETELLMKQVAEELSKIEYIPILSKLADERSRGIKSKLLNFSNKSVSRRYIKPHRCNYQAPLSNVFGGPRWIICTGYLNINTPSVYD